MSPLAAPPCTHRRRQPCRPPGAPRADADPCRRILRAFRRQSRGAAQRARCRSRLGAVVRPRGLPSLRRRAMDMTVATAPLHRIALAACARDGDAANAEASWLTAQRDALIAAAGEPIDLGQWLVRWRRAPPAGDARLATLSATLQLSTAELLAVALACAAETDAMIGRVLAWLQAPVGGARPTLGLVAMLAERFGDDLTFAALAGGMARASGLIQFEGNSRALPEAALSVPLPVVFALADATLRLAPPGVRVAMTDPPVLPPSLRHAAAARARALAPGGALVVRSGHPREARAVAMEVAAA